MAYCPDHNRTVFGDSCPQCAAEEAALTRKGVERDFVACVTVISPDRTKWTTGYVPVRATSVKDAKAKALPTFAANGFMRKGHPMYHSLHEVETTGPHNTRSPRPPGPFLDHVYRATPQDGD